MRAVYQGRTGLLPPSTGIAPIVYEDLRMTIPVRELLMRHGATVVQVVEDWMVTLGSRMPEGILAVQTIGEWRIALRLGSEPHWPMEVEAGWDVRACWLPCPKCGAPLVWCEAGYVPGYRVCAKAPYHHVLVQS